MLISLLSCVNSLANKVHALLIYLVQNCNDGIQNGDEEGVDCGESAGCDLCPSCFDGIQNGDEEGVDCGGSGGCSICGKNFMNERWNNLYD